MIYALQFFCGCIAWFMIFAEDFNQGLATSFAKWAMISAATVHLLLSCIEATKAGPRATFGAAFLVPFLLCSGLLLATTTLHNSASWVYLTATLTAVGAIGAVVGRVLMHMFGDGAVRR